MLRGSASRCTTLPAESTKRGYQEGIARLLPGSQFFLGQRLEELRADFETPFPTAGLALALAPANRLQANQWRIAARDDDLFSLAGFGDQAGEVGFCVMDFNDGHVS